MSARHLLLTWVTGKQSMSSVQRSSLRLQTCEEDIISTIMVCLLGKWIKTLLLYYIKSRRWCSVRKS